MKSIQALTLVACIASCAFVHAQTTQGTVGGCTVTGVDVRSNGSFLVTLSAPMANQPTCATNHLRVTGDGTTAGGKALLSAAMLAYSTHSTLSLVQGTGACTEYSGYESVLILAQVSS